MPKVITAGETVSIVDPNIAMGLGNCKYIPGMHGSKAKIVGKFEDLVHNKCYNPVSHGKFVVEMDGVRIPSSFIDKGGKHRPSWYVLPRMINMGGQVIDVLVQ